ncbi:hypothetical protein B5M09_002321 [Aphanomyces astaci]|uniref:DNA polymerase II subunit 2 n=1 Tax=Aphanomyces astaci TaxID=112090 RepID=A0A3R7YGV3_APHAT|nr:hypothetical protein B5M09_002321 [Aphanomyces astaci]
MIVEGFLTSLSTVKSSVVSQDALESALDTLLNVSSDNDYQCIQVFNAFDQPKLIFHPSTKTYEVSADPTRKLHASSAHRLSLFRERYARTHHIIIRSSSHQLTQIQQLERNQELDCFVVLSDVHLDEPAVMARLDALFSGYEPFTPTLFILMGNFTSSPVGYGYGTPASSKTIRTLKQHFDDLATLLLKYPALVEKSQFLFVPGPDDPGAPHVLPRHPVCLVKTLVDQGHLCPLPIAARPIHWAYDSALQMFPLPDVVCVSVFHPGPFYVDYSFVLYRPASNTAEVSRVDID